VEETIRAAIAGFSPGHVFTSDQLARELGFDHAQVVVWLDLLADEGHLIAEHGIISEAEHGVAVVHYRIPLH
jgi:hypothetical protein